MVVVVVLMPSNVPFFRAELRGCLFSLYQCAYVRHRIDKKERKGQKRVELNLNHALMSTKIIKLWKHGNNGQKEKK